MIARVLLPASLLLIPLTTLAADNGPSANMLAWALQTGGLLVLVLGLFLALIFLLNRVRRYPAAGSRMRLLETLPISRSEKVCRVQIGDQILIIGVTPGGITRLGEQPVEEKTTVVNIDSPFFKILGRCRSIDSRSVESRATEAGAL